MQPIQSAIESLHAKELCPRLHVDVTHADAVCPDFVREKWKEQMVIDLDPSYPLDLAFTRVGVEADLSFGGYVTRCVFPWSAIYVVADRDAGTGKVFERHIPESLRHKFTATRSKPTIDPKLTEARDDMGAKRSSRRKRRREPKQAPQIEAVPEAVTEEAPEEAPPSAEAPTEADVKSRRAAFKVIDGDG